MLLLIMLLLMMLLLMMIILLTIHVLKMRTMIGNEERLIALHHFFYISCSVQYIRFFFLQPSVRTVLPTRRSLVTYSSNCRILALC